MAELAAVGRVAARRPAVVEQVAAHGDLWGIGLVLGGADAGVANNLKAIDHRVDALHASGQCDRLGLLRDFRSRRRRVSVTWPFWVLDLDPVAGQPPGCP